MPSGHKFDDRVTLRTRTWLLATSFSSKPQEQPCTSDRRSLTKLENDVIHCVWLSYLC